MHRKLRERFSVTLRTSAGLKFRGEFGAPNSFPRPRKEIQNLPHRALVTARNSVAKAGDLVRSNGQEYLLCGQHVQHEIKRFLAVEVNNHLLWSRIGEITDPVTGMPKDEDAETIMDPALPVVIEPGREIEEQRFGQTQYRLLTAADVKEGDLLGDMTVTRAMDLLGLRMVEAT